MRTFVVLALMAVAVILHAQPYQPTAIWQREGACDSSIYGENILALGDQNGDSLNDWAVYAHGWGPPGQPCEPRVEFFHGGTPPDTIPYMVRLTSTPEEAYIWGASSLGDLNGDGYVDWTIVVELTGDPQHRNVQKIYFGGPGQHEQPDLQFFTSGLFPIGDFNADGYDDICLTSSAILYGGNPMDTIPDWVRGAYLGYVSGGGDLNHDGYSDFVGCCNGSGYLDVYLGGTEPDTLPTYHWPSATSTPAIVRDMNGDTYDDLCLSQSGWGKVLYGEATMDTVSFANLDFPCSGSGPLSIASAGDFNGDGFGDVVMLHEWCENSYWGVLTMHLGGWWINPEPAFVIYGWTPPLDLIHIKRAANLGDVNGDGIDDLAIGANGTPEYAAYRGKAVVLRGDTSLHVAAPEPPNPLPEALEVIAYPNPFNGSATIRITLPPFRDQVELAVVNLLGQQVQAATLHHVVGRATYTLDAAGLSTGLYLLHVSSGHLQSTTKLMVLK